MVNYTAEEILNRLAGYYKIDGQIIFTPTRNKENISNIRFEFIYLMYRFSGLNRKNIGEKIDRHPSIVNHAVEVIVNKCSAYPEFRKKIIDIENLFE